MSSRSNTATEFVSDISDGSRNRCGHLKSSGSKDGKKTSSLLKYDSNSRKSIAAHFAKIYGVSESEQPSICEDLADTAKDVQLNRPPHKKKGRGRTKGSNKGFNNRGSTRCVIARRKPI